MKPSPGQAGGGRCPQRLLLLPPVALLLGGILATTVGGVPTSVLASAKDSSNAANHDDSGGGGSDAAHQQSVTADPLDARNHQISVPQKRGVNPLLYNDLDYSGNSIPHGGQWDDEGLFDQGPLSAAALYPTLGAGHPSDGAASVGRLRNYDLLASLLGPPPQPPVQTFYDGPVTPSVSFPYGYGYGLDRNKRMANFGHGKNQRQRSLSASRLKRSPGKLSAADALSLLAILDSRDPYSAAAGGPLSEYGPNDVLPYSPSSLMAMANQATQDIPLSLALAQLLAERNSLGGGGGGGGPLLSPYGDLGNGDDDGGDGQWMNSWTEPGVDYMGFPMDVGAGRLNGGYGIGKPSKIGFTPQKRFMVSKRKRSVGSQQEDNDTDEHHERQEQDVDCKSDQKGCLLRKYGQLAGSRPKVEASA